MHKSDAPNKSRIQLQQRVDRLKAVALNHQIANHASRKELSESITIFRESVNNGWANSHTYAAILNAYVRCGDMTGAKAVFEELKERKNIPLDVISCTTLLKGFCSIGDINSAVQLFSDMDNAKPKVLPNIRTLNTFFRGCLLAGTVDKGVEMFARMQNTYNLTPDISTWEYIVNLLCQGLNLDRALPMIGRLKGQPEHAGAVGAMLVHVARSRALLRDWKACRKAIQGARVALTQDETCNNKNKNSSDREGGDCEDQDGSLREKHATGGKKAWRETEVDESRERSLEVHHALYCSTLHCTGDLKIVIHILCIAVSRASPCGTEGRAGRH